MKNYFFVFILLILSSCTTNESKSNLLLLDMVHHNPGESFTNSKFNDPVVLKDYGFDAQVINEFQSVHCAITYDSLSKDIFPLGSSERLWVDSLASRIDNKIKSIHKAGLKAYYFMDIIVLPKRLIEMYSDEICDSTGWVDITRPKTQEIHRVMLNEVFNRFPELDGLVIRVGETYLHNVPFHSGNGPIKKKNTSWKHNNVKKTDGGENTHALLINLLREEVCDKLHKDIIYRTWDFGYFHTNPEYYLEVTNQVEVHPNLYFAIKHVAGDYHRTIPFNPLLGIGKHKQIVEVQCQREYEGKGAYPNYIANGVINGFEEEKKSLNMHSLKEFLKSPLFAGIWTWSRGGGWVGPYIKNELWCDLNTYVLCKWGQNPARTEEELFNEFAIKIGVADTSLNDFRRLALLSSDAVVRGRGSLIYPINVWWTRDEFIGGMDELKSDFEYIYKNNLSEKVLNEKRESVEIWRKMMELSNRISCTDLVNLDYIRVSTEYGYRLYSIYSLGWHLLWLCYKGEVDGKYDVDMIKKLIQSYDESWKEYLEFCNLNEQAATPYKPYAFVNKGPVYHKFGGLKKTIDYYLNKIE